MASLNQRISDLEIEKNRMNQVTESNGKFQTHLMSLEMPAEMQGKFEIRADGTFDIQCFGNAIKLERRIVRSRSGHYLMEYNFTANCDDELLPVFKFYLFTNGKLYKDSDQKAVLCEFMDGDVGKILLVELLERSLRSRLFLSSDIAV